MLLRGAVAAVVLLQATQCTCVLQAEAYLDGHDAALPGIALLRGGSVAVLVVLSCDGEEFVLLTEQPRVPVGRARLLELPAGMMDDSGAFKGNAARELEEEAGLTVHDSELVDMTQLAFGEEQPGVYPSPGGLDEFMRLLLLRRRVAREELERIRSHAGGLREEGEIISLRMVPLRDLWHTCHDAKSLAALALYTQLREAGRLPEPLRE